MRNIHPGVNPAGTEVAYDGRDNDCNTSTPDDDLDGDGWGLFEDCDDTDSAFNPDVPDTTEDGFDQDCNGVDACATVALPLASNLAT